MHHVGGVTPPMLYSFTTSVVALVASCCLPCSAVNYLMLESMPFLSDLTTHVLTSPGCTHMSHDACAKIPQHTCSAFDVIVSLSVTAMCAHVHLHYADLALFPLCYSKVVVVWPQLGHYRAHCNALVVSISLTASTGFTAHMSAPFYVQCFHLQFHSHSSSHFLHELVVCLSGQC